MSQPDLTSSAIVVASTTVAATVVAPPATREALQRQATATLDRAFQNLFTLVSEVIALYKQREAIDGAPSDIDPRLEVTPAHVIDENLRAYKACFDTTGPDVHVDTVLELYSKVRSSLHRGYQCNSWLTNGAVSFYYGVSAAEAGHRVVHLDCVHLMLESLRRADTQFRNSAAAMRIRFAYLLYGVFAACLRYANVVDSEKNVRGVNPEVTVESDLSVLETLLTETLNDIPKPERPAAAAGPAVGASPLAGLAAMFPGGFGDIVSSLMKTLPDITRTVTETVARTTGTEVTPRDQSMIDTTMSNITDILGKPDTMREMLAEVTNGGGFGRIVERLLSGVNGAGAAGPATAAAASTPAAVTAPPPAPSPGGGPALD